MKTIAEMTATLERIMALCPPESLKAFASISFTREVLSFWE